MGDRGRNFARDSSAQSRQEPRQAYRDAGQPTPRDRREQNLTRERSRNDRPAGNAWSSAQPGRESYHGSDRRGSWQNDDTRNRGSIDRDGYNRERYSRDRYSRDRAWSHGGNRYGNGHYESRSWNRNWRDDHRYDWRGYRSQHHHIYRSGYYYAPYPSYAYSRIAIGFTIGPLYYGQQYWISDPWYYRLPAVYGPYRWVRYYNDVLLIDIYNGLVVDVIYDFFW